MKYQVMFVTTGFSKVFDNETDAMAYIESRGARFIAKETFGGYWVTQLLAE